MEDPRISQKLEVYQWRVYPKSSPNWGDMYQVKVKPTVANMKKASVINYKGKEYFKNPYKDFSKANPSFKPTTKAKPKKMMKKATRKATKRIIPRKVTIKPKANLGKLFKFPKLFGKR